MTVTVSDGFLTDTETFTLTITPVNDVPVADALSATTSEDTPVEIIFTGSDIDGDELTFEVVNAAINGIYADGFYTPSQDFNGEDSFTYRAFDGTDYSDPASVTLTVTSVNDSPVLTSIGDQTTDEDSPLTITLTGSDVDGDALT